MDCFDKDMLCEKCDFLKYWIVVCGVCCGICSFWGYFDKECMNCFIGELSINDVDGGYVF